MSVNFDTWTYVDENGTHPWLLSDDEKAIVRAVCDENGGPGSMLGDELAEILAAEFHGEARKRHVEDARARRDGDAGTGAITSHRGDELDDIQSAELLVDGLLPRGALCVVQGRHSTFKSYVALELALAVANGGEAFGRNRARQGSVYYVAAEGSNELGNRRRAIVEARGYDLGATDERFIWTEDHIDLYRNQKSISALRAELRKYQPTLLVIDTLNMVSGSADENGSQQTEVMKNIETLRRELPTNATAIVIAHTNKADQDARGSSGIGDTARHILHIKREEDSPVAVIKVRKSKSGIEGRKITVRAESVELSTGGREAVLREVDPSELKGKVIARAGGEVEVGIVDLLRASRDSGELYETRSSIEKRLKAGVLRDASRRNVGAEVTATLGELVQRGVICSMAVARGGNAAYFLNEPQLVEEVSAKHPEKVDTLKRLELDPFDPALMAPGDLDGQAA